jgi:hypothetical protein
MSFICGYCKYYTKIKYNFEKHTKTAKHLYNIKENKHCTKCNKTYSTPANYRRHLQTVHNIINDIQINIDDNDSNIPNQNNNIVIDKINKKNKKNKINKINKLESNKILSDKIDASNKLITNKIDDLNKSNQQVVSVVNNAINRASSLIKYLIENHNTTPPLKKLNYDECINLLKLDYNCSDKDYTLQEKLIKEYKNNLFIKKISQSILKLLNHKNPDKQPIWNTDCTRNHYIVKTTTSWNEDKAGIKFTECIIKPLLNYIRQLIFEYRTQKLENMCGFDMSTEEIEKHLNHMCTTLTLESAIIDEKLIPNFLRELSPHLRYLEQEIEEYEDIRDTEKLKELQKNFTKIINQDINKNININKNNIDDDSYDIDDDLYNHNNYIYSEDDDYNDSSDDDIYISQTKFKKRIV